jgi:hypothetical protein
MRKFQLKSIIVTTKGVSSKSFDVDYDFFLHFMMVCRHKTDHKRTPGVLRLRVCSLIRIQFLRFQCMLNGNVQNELSILPSLFSPHESGKSIFFCIKIHAMLHLNVNSNFMWKCRLNNRIRYRKPIKFHVRQ